jgi:hypothetical protein
MRTVIAWLRPGLTVIRMMTTVIAERSPKLAFRKRVNDPETGSNPGHGVSDED